MKKEIIILIFLSVFFTGKTYAQRYFNSKIVTAGATISKNEYGLYGSYEKLFGYNKNSFFADFTPLYRTQELRSQDFKANIVDLNLGAGYRRYFDLDLNLFTYGGVGGFLGYEAFINKNKMPESTYYTRKFGFQYGVFLDFGVEYMLDTYGLNVGVRPLYNFRNEELNLNFIISLKYYLR